VEKITFFAMIYQKTGYIEVTKVLGREIFLK